MLMYVFYFAETVEKIVQTINKYIIKQHRVKNYLWLKLKDSLTGNYQSREQIIIPYIKCYTQLN